jgi:hypothetical protein
MDKIAIIAFFKLLSHLMILTVTEIPITRQNTMFMRRDLGLMATAVKGLSNFLVSIVAMLL